MTRLLIGLCAFSLLSFLFVSPAIAQDGDRRERRRQLVEGILRTLVESQMQQHLGDRPAPPRPGPGRGREDAEPRQIRQTLEGFSGEAGNLITSLRHEEQYAPSIRPLLGDALRVKATADVLARRSQTVLDDRVLANDFQPLDRQWRILAHRLRQFPDLDATCVSRLERLNQYDRRLCQLLRVEPQLERRQLAQELTALAADLQGLSENISIASPHGHQRHHLLAEGRRLQLLANQVSHAVVSGQNHEAVVAVYKQFATGWRQFSAKLRPLENRYLARGVQRVEDRKNHIQDLLWIPYTVDRDEMLYCAGTLNKRVEGLLASISLRELMSLPMADAVLVNAREFTALCDKLGKSITGGARRDDLLWDYRLLDVEWQQLQDQLQTCQEETILQHLEAVEQGVALLRDSLGIEPNRDHETALHLAATVDTLAEVLSRDVRHRVGASGRYSPQFRDQAVRCAAGFHEQAHRFHESVSQRPPMAQLRGQASQLFEQWDQLRTYLLQCTGNDKVLLAQTAHRVAPAVAKLQLLFAY